MLFLLLSSFLFFYDLNFKDLLPYSQIRLKHMITQGAAEQSPWTSGSKSTNMGNPGRILETNTDNIRRMVLLNIIKFLLS